MPFDPASNFPVATEINSKPTEASSPASKWNPNELHFPELGPLLQFLRAIIEHAIASLTEQGGGLTAWTPDASRVASGSPGSEGSPGIPSVASLSCTDRSARLNAKPLALPLFGLLLLPIMWCTVFAIQLHTFLATRSKDIGWESAMALHASTVRLRTQGQRPTS
jgi:hypothetical protein